MPTPQEIAYDQTVREDIELFRQQAEAFTAGQLTISSAPYVCGEAFTASASPVFTWCAPKCPPAW